MTDHYAVNSSAVVQEKIIDDTYKIKEFVKTQTETLNLTSNIFQGTIQYVNEDFVIIIFQTDNILL